MSETVSDDIGVGELLKVIWRGRWVALVSTALGLGCALGALLIVDKRYTATIQVSVVGGGGGSGLGGLGALASQFGAVASLAGISLGDGGSKAEHIAVLHSDDLTRRFIEERQLLPVMYRGIWDQATNTWRVADARDQPTLWKATQYFNRNVRAITEDKAAGLLRLSITWSDPVLAAEWANGLISLANSHLQSRRVAEAERNISYLQSEVSKTDVAQVRSAIYSVMEAEIKSAMMARGADEFAFRTVSAAVAPEVPSFPQRLLFLVGGVCLGFAVAAAFLLLRYAWTGGRG